MNGSITWSRLFALFGGYLGLAHYVHGIGFTLWYAAKSDVPDVYLRFLLPYIGIAGIFVAVVMLAHRRRTRTAWLAVLLGLVVSAGMFAYDLKHSRHQMAGDGHGRHFWIWWWYYEPFWQGYEPGNV